MKVHAIDKDTIQIAVNIRKQHLNDFANELPQLLKLARDTYPHDTAKAMAFYTERVFELGAMVALCESKTV